jgi:hypothetical protein
MQGKQEMGAERGLEYLGWGSEGGGAKGTHTCEQTP